MATVETGIRPLCQLVTVAASPNFSAILSARTLPITIRGDQKRELLERAIEDGHSSKLPIGKVLAEAEQPIDIHWCS